LQRSLAKRGLGGTVRAGLDYLTEPFASYRPRRLAKRFTDWRYDRRHHVDTSVPVVLGRLRIEAPSLRSGKRYQATSERIFRRALESLPIEHRNFAFLDFGSGKGKCLLMAADYPFAEIVGVEFAPELVEIARRNFRTYRSRRQKCRNLQTVACDAALYPVPARPSIFYFYNPFGPDILMKVVENIRRSLQAFPRPAYFLYLNPFHREVFDQAGWLSILKECPDYCIYVPDRP